MARRPEIRALTGVRALAAIWVVLYHLDGKAFHVSTAGPLGVFLDAWVRSGSIGVELFFVLSGLILSYNYAERMATPSLRAYREFLVMRLARIYPVHLFTLLLLVPLYLVASRTGILDGDLRQYGADEFAKNVLLIHNWFPPAVESWNVQSWSISAEWLAYLAFPVMLPVLGRVGGKRALLASLALAAALGLVFDVGRLDGVEWGVLRIAFAFTAGCLAYQAWSHGALRSLRWETLTPILTGLVLLLPPVLALLGRDLRWMTPVMLLFLYGLSQERDVVSRLLATPALQFGGRVSFSLYMTHGLVIRVLPRLVPLPPDASVARAIPVLLLYLAATSAAAVLTYGLVEEPSRRRVAALQRRWAGPAPKPALEPAAPIALDV